MNQNTTTTIRKIEKFAVCETCSDACVNGVQRVYIRMKRLAVSDANLTKMMLWIRTVKKAVWLALFL